MKINDKRKNKVTFREIDEGTVFSYLEVFYMKTEVTYDNGDGYYENAVILTSGELVFFKDDTEIIPVKCELTIEM